MRSMHFAFCPEQQFGHIMPTLGLAIELAKRGHRVSYAIIEALVPLIRHTPAKPMIIQPMLDSRLTIVKTVYRENDCSTYNYDQNSVNMVNDLINERTSRLLLQLEQLYRHDMPDVIIHDDVFDKAGRAFASKFEIAKVRLRSQFISDEIHQEWSGGDPLAMFTDDELILVLVPRFFQTELERLDNDKRFRFVGFIAEGRSRLLGPWEHNSSGVKPILVTTTTGNIPQLNFCQVMLDAFRVKNWNVVLSLSGGLDAATAIDPMSLHDIPKNVHVNTSAGNFQILETSRLYIGQGGQGGTLEALYWGVPQLVIPPTPYHHFVARRVAELGLGYCLPISELSQESVIERVSALLNDEATRHRVEIASNFMQNSPSAELAADEIEAYVAGRSVISG